GDEDDDEDEEEEGGDEEGLDLQRMAADAEWEASSLLDMPPEVLLRAAEAAEAEAREGHWATPEDEAALSRIIAKCRALLSLQALSIQAASHHPGGQEAADMQVAEAMAAIRRAEAEASGAALRAAVMGV
ncbi:hypothetical protein Agub_g4674, partial [Astrephomene gubernaculifera]